MRGAVLAYHSQNCGGYDYTTNDHHAFERDLRTVSDFHLPVVSLREIATKISAGMVADLPEHFVAFSCDDGTLLDWSDYEHPRFGHQRSLANILRDHVSRHNMADSGQLTSFVIASPEARKAIDEGCYLGAALSADDWWAPAAEEGLLAIENHSWDHVHAGLPAGLLTHGSAGDFYTVNSHGRADQQVRAASEFIDRRLAATGQRTALFAYPYGHASAYLADTYFPQYRDEHGIIGAFTTEQKFVDTTTRVYEIPRLVCGEAWRTPEQFERILQQLVQKG